MLTHVYSSIFESPAQTLVNTVNIVGVMGKGIAKEFKQRYPNMYKEYRELCDKDTLQTGTLHLWKSDTRWVLNFPTKTTWQKPSKIEYIEAGLDAFVRHYRKLGITSIAFPPLGCGNGNLDWINVRPIMISYLKRVNIPVYIHDIQVGSAFIPEHREDINNPSTYVDFLKDIRASIYKNKTLYETMESRNLFNILILEDNTLQVKHKNGKMEYIPPEEIEFAWEKLRNGILSNDRYSDERARRYKSYLFPVLAGLPYVRSISIRREDQPVSVKSKGLFLDRDLFVPYREAISAEGDHQHCLFR